MSPILHFLPPSIFGRQPTNMAGMILGYIFQQGEEPNLLQGGQKDYRLLEYQAFEHTRLRYGTNAKLSTLSTPFVAYQN